jgi:hypothetical protein
MHKGFGERLITKVSLPVERDEGLGFDCGGDCCTTIDPGVSPWEKVGSPMSPFELAVGERRVVFVPESNHLPKKILSRLFHYDVYEEFMAIGIERGSGDLFYAHFQEVGDDETHLDCIPLFRKLPAELQPYLASLPKSGEARLVIRDEILIEYMKREIGIKDLGEFYAVELDFTDTGLDLAMDHSKSACFYDGDDYTVDDTPGCRVVIHKEHSVITWSQVIVHDGSNRVLSSTDQLNIEYRQRRNRASQRAN